MLPSVSLRLQAYTLLCSVLKSAEYPGQPTKQLECFALDAMRLAASNPKTPLTFAALTAKARSRSHSFWWSSGAPLPAIAEVGCGFSRSMDGASLEFHFTQRCDAQRRFCGYVPVAVLSAPSSDGERQIVRGAVAQNEVECLLSYACSLAAVEDKCVLTLLEPVRSTQSLLAVVDPTLSLPLLMRPIGTLSSCGKRLREEHVIDCRYDVEHSSDRDAARFGDLLLQHLQSSSGAMSASSLLASLQVQLSIVLSTCYLPLWSYLLRCPPDVCLLLSLWAADAARRTIVDSEYWSVRGGEQARVDAMQQLLNAASEGCTNMGPQYAPILRNTMKLLRDTLLAELKSPLEPQKACSENEFQPNSRCPLLMAWQAARLHECSYRLE